MAEQLTFDLPVRDSRAKGDFFVSDANAMAVARLETSDTWPNGKLVLIGPEGAGKSHLAHVWAESAGGQVLSLSDLLELDIPAVETPIAIENAENLTSASEEALFHLHNHMGASGLPLLLIARVPPAQWSIGLPDLKSRMMATDSVRIDPPDDALLAAVMVKQFADRQLSVSPQVITWLVTHMDRSFGTAQRLVGQLDRVALSEGRAITRPLAQKVLNASPE